tara:strand:- start:129 stop:413 length:285 start_codon:yes stop_codon:yes gene_type:complete
MTSNTPIYSLAKELEIDSKRIILACKKIGIAAKGATRRLNQDELEKVKTYFETGKNVSEEIVEVSKVNEKKKKTAEIKRVVKTNYFPNRLIGKS